MKSYAIRPAASEDDVGIRKVQVATWKSTYRGMIPDEILDQMSVENPPRRSKAPDPKLMDSRRSFVACKTDGEIIGFAVGGLSRSPEHGYPSELWAIYVLKAFQGQGIGKELFTTIRNALISSYERMIIWVLEANHPTHGFYESMGGIRLDLKKPFCWNDKAVSTEIAFGWNLK